MCYNRGLGFRKIKGIIMDELKIVEEYRAGKSTCVLAKEYDTYQNRIARILKKHNEPLRTSSEAQKIALEAGRSEHPTQGKKASEETKVSQSKSQTKRWATMAEADKIEFKEGAKERWETRSLESKKAMLTKAGYALQKASKEGSKAEKHIYSKLQEAGYTVVMHKKGLIPGDYELDLYLPETNIVIEIDGPQHFLPVFGEELLAKNIRYDTIKNGLLMNKGITVIRVKYIIKHLSEKVKRELWDKILNTIIGITSGVIINKLVEIEING